MLKKRPLDLPRYATDFLRYEGLSKHMFWFQKFKGRQWLYGQNFGDYLSFIIVGELLKQSGTFPLPAKRENGKLLALGSILHFAENDDVIWGTGVNGKIPDERFEFDSLDVRMVRGPLTRDFLLQRGIFVPSDVYGDPALLLPSLFPKLKAKPISGRITVLPNFNELEQIMPLVPQGFTLVSPIAYWKNVVREILRSELVLTSSLHGLIVSEVFGVPVRFVAPCGGETFFKYEDYLLGTGRSLNDKPASFLAGIDKNIGVTIPPPKINAEKMIELFPVNFFK